MESKEENSEPQGTIRVAVDLDIDILYAIDKIKVQLGLGSRGFVINQLLRELLAIDGIKIPKDVAAIGQQDFDQ
jgi:hypothetical protein